MLENKTFLTLKIEIRKASIPADYSASLLERFSNTWPSAYSEIPMLWQVRSSSQAWQDPQHPSHGKDPDDRRQAQGEIHPLARLRELEHREVDTASLKP
jgi:hypothetical protein